MECIKMKYRGFEFSVNVKSINASLSKRTASFSPIKKGGKMQEICEEPAVITAQGCFLGRDAEENANMLMMTFKEEGADYLFSPLFPPMVMIFSDLKLSADAGKNRIDYSVKFIEKADVKKRRHFFGYTYAKSGENAFDIANRCSVRVDRIAESNCLKDLFSIREGDKIWLE